MVAAKDKRVKACGAVYPSIESAAARRVIASPQLIAFLKACLA